MHMLVRIDVAGFTAHQLTKRRKLAGDLLPHLKKIV